MKGKILLLLFTILLSVPSFAQKQRSDDDSKRKEMMEFKLKFLGDEMGLNDAQRKQFNELYTQMESERRAVYKKIKSAENFINENKNASEADYEKARKDISNAKSQMAQIEQNYYNKFVKFLSQKQLYKLKEAEEKFKETMQKVRNKKKNQK